MTVIVRNKEQDRDTSRTAPAHLINPDDKHELIPATFGRGSAEFFKGLRRKDAGLVCRQPELLDWASVGLVPLIHKWNQVLVDPCTNLCSERGMVLVVVRGRYTAVPSGFRERTRIAKRFVLHAQLAWSRRHESQSLFEFVSCRAKNQMGCLGVPMWLTFNRENAVNTSGLRAEMWTRLRTSSSSF